MKRLPKRLRLPTVLIFVGIVLILVFRGGKSARSSRTFDLNSTQEKPQSLTLSFTEELQKKESAPEPFFRAAALKRLKLKWNQEAEALRTKGIITENHTSLAKESVDQLMCGPELLDLIQYMEKLGISADYKLISQELERLFRSDRAEAARKILIALPDDKASIRDASGRYKYTDITNYKELWAYRAGKGCNEAEYTAFVAELKDPRTAQSALFGYLVSMADEKPEAAFSAYMRALRNGNHAVDEANGIMELIQKIPENANFPKLEQSMSPQNLKERVGDTMEYARDRFFRKWAEYDPAAAANYVMSVPDRLHPRNVSLIVEAMALRDPGKAVAWAQEFPHGIYYDQAVFILLSHISSQFPSEAKELASFITDPALKVESAQILKMNE